MIEHLNIDKNLKRSDYITGNRGSAYIPACEWYKKPQWRGGSCDKSNDGSKCFEINISFQWETRYDSLTLYLEYTTSPYKTRKQLAEYSESFMNDYTQTRQMFYEHVKNSNVEMWTMKKTPLRIAKFSFDKAITFDELKKNVNELISIAINVVDDWFRLKHNEGGEYYEK